MKRKILTVALAAGTVLGFGHGFASMARCHSHHQARRAAFEDHVADVCVDAALRAQDREAAYAAYDAPPPPPPRYEAQPQGCDHGRDGDRADRRRHHRRHRHDGPPRHIQRAQVAPIPVAPAP